MLVSHVIVLWVGGWFQLIFQISRRWAHSSGGELLSFWNCFSFVHLWISVDVWQWHYSSWTQWSWSSRRLYDSMSFQTTMNGLALFNTKTPFSAYQKSLSEFNGSQPLWFINHLDSIEIMFCVCVFFPLNLTFYNSFSEFSGSQLLW